MPSGILIVDKPRDWTSMDVCARLRGVFHERRIGHGGTLDPMATGVLPVFVGTATRAVSFAADADKEYLVEIQLGVITNTQDTTGQVLERRPVEVSRARLEAALAPFRGEILQVPPMYSAVKVGGKKLYELARQGREVARAPRPVTIRALAVEGQTGPDRYALRVRCSKGTYVRTLCHDIGQALGCGGAMAALRRTMAGGFTLADSTPLEAILAAGDPAALLRPLDSLFADCPAHVLDGGRRERLCRNGNPVPAPELAPGRYRVYGADGTFLCLSRWQDGALKAEKNFFGE